SLFAGDETENEVYGTATEFAGKSNNAESFDKAPVSDSVQKLIADNIKISDFSINGIGPSREIIRWMYEAEVGDVSQVFALPGKYIVAKISEINKKGMVPLDSTLRQNLAPQVRNQKKAEMIVKKYESAKSLSEIATAT